MNPYTIISIAAAWALILITSIIIHQRGMHKKNSIEKNLTEHIDKLRHDAFLEHKDFDGIAKKRLSINHKDGYTNNRPAMQTDVIHIRGTDKAKTIDNIYQSYKKTSTYARIASTIANICTIGIYWILA